MFGMNPKKMAGMMKKLGMSQENIDAEEVIIRTPNKKIIVKPAEVARIKMKGQESFQVSGEVHEEAGEGNEEIKDESEEKENELPYKISEEDVKTIMEKTECSEDKAIDTLIKNEGDIAKTILELKK